MNEIPKPGDIIRMRGSAYTRTVLGVRPYNGPFKWVACIVRLSSPYTESGHIDCSWEMPNDFERVTPA